MAVIIKTNLKPNTSLNSVHTVKKLIESLGGADKAKSIKLRGVLKEFETNSDIRVLTFKTNICYSHKAKELARLNNYVKAIVCAINLDIFADKSCHTNKQKIRTIKSALLIEKLIKDNNFTNQKNKFSHSVLKDIIGEYVKIDTLNRYSNKAKELVEINFLQFNVLILNALEVLKSKYSDRVLVNCQIRINTTDVSIFKEFDTADTALQYVRVCLLNDIKQQQNLNQTSKAKKLKI